MRVKDLEGYRFPGYEISWGRPIVKGTTDENSWARYSKSIQVSVEEPFWKRISIDWNVHYLSIWFLGINIEYTDYFKTKRYDQ